MDEVKEFKAFEKAILKNPITDIEELSDEHRFIFEWFWKRYEKIREKAWMYDDLSD